MAMAGEEVGVALEQAVEAELASSHQHQCDRGQGAFTTPEVSPVLKNQTQKVVGRNTYSRGQRNQHTGI